MIQQKPLSFPSRCTRRHILGWTSVTVAGGILASCTGIRLESGLSGDPGAATFLSLSGELTGMNGLGSTRALEIRKAVTALHSREKMEQMLSRFLQLARAGLRSGRKAACGLLLEDPDLGPVARDVLMLWFTGADRQEGRRVPWHEQLAWQVTGAFPPGIPGGQLWHRPFESMNYLSKTNGGFNGTL